MRTIVIIIGAVIWAAAVSCSADADIKNNRDLNGRIDLFNNNDPAKLPAGVQDNLMPVDTAYKKSALAASVSGTVLIDSVVDRTSNNRIAVFYLYRSYIQSVYNVRMAHPPEKVYFIAGQKLLFNDGNIFIFLLPLKNTIALQQHGNIQWQWLPGAPVVAADSVMIKRWQSLNYFAPVVVKKGTGKKKRRFKARQEFYGGY